MSQPRSSVVRRCFVFVISSLAVSIVALGSLALPASAAPVTRIQLEVLVLTDGGPAVGAIVDQLNSEGVPNRTIDLNSTSRPVVNAQLLSGTVTVGGVVTPLARYQAVVLPNASPTQLTDAEKSALAQYQAAFNIRGVYAYTYASPLVGLNEAVGSGYAGSLDGTIGRVTDQGKAAGFGYLKADVPFDDNDPNVPESYGYVSTPVPNQAPGATFRPLVTVDAGNVSGGSLVGVYELNGTENLVVTFVYRSEQLQYRLLAHGMVTWMTRGIHLGYQRNYYSVQVDDVFLPDSRWSIENNCTPGEDCAPGITTPDIRMTPTDVSHVTNWQNGLGARFPISQGFKLDIVFNGAGVDEAKAANGGTDPMSAALLSPSTRANYRWINHTWSHAYLGCVQDTTVIPWACKKDASGKIVWTSANAIQDEITKNRTFAKNAGLNSLPADQYAASELVTGEHSGLQRLPLEPTDNPNLARALKNVNIKTVASDASRETDTRVVGGANTVPRYPVSGVYFNNATKAEAVSEYNWIYGSRSNGGSGYCEDHPDTTTCLPAPLGTNGFTDYIVPFETRQQLGRITANNPRPYFAHQSNLAEDYLLLTMVDSVLNRYNNLHTVATPLVNLSHTAIATELVRQKAWPATLAGGKLTGYVSGTQVTVTNASGQQLTVPLTLPNGTTAGGSAFGAAYGGELSALTKQGAGATKTYRLAAGAGWPTGPATPAPVTADVQPLRVPEALTKKGFEQTALTPDDVIR